MFMFDTNAFNRVLDSGLDPSFLTRRGPLFVTHIQINELQATTRPERRDQLLKCFASIEQEKIPTAAGVWGVSEWGGAEWGSAEGTYDAMLANLNGMNGGKKNNAQDILIAVTALKHGFTLVTDDNDLAIVLREVGGATECFGDFIRKSRR